MAFVGHHCHEHGSQASLHGEGRHSGRRKTMNGSIGGHSGAGGSHNDPTSMPPAAHLLVPPGPRGAWAVVSPPCGSCKVLRRRARRAGAGAGGRGHGTARGAVCNPAGCAAGTAAGCPPRRCRGGEGFACPVLVRCNSLTTSTNRPRGTGGAVHALFRCPSGPLFPHTATPDAFPRRPLVCCPCCAAPLLEP